MDASALSRWQERLDDEVLFERLVDNGLASLAFAEIHLKDLVEGGRVVAQTAPEFALTLASGGLGQLNDEVQARLQGVSESGIFLISSDSSLKESMLPQWKILFGDEVESFLDGRVIWFPQTDRQLKSAGLGFDLAEIVRLNEKGFSVWLRPENRVGLTEPQLLELFEQWREIPGVQGVIFGGALNEVIGYPDLLEVSARMLEELGWKIGYIELSPGAQQDGIETMVRTLPSQVVRVLAVSPAHQAKLSPFRVLGMYSLGARERNIRVCYVRPYDVPGRPELDEEFLFGLPGQLQHAGPADLFDAQATPGPGLLLTAFLGLVGGALLLLLVEGVGLRITALWWSVLLLGPVAGIGATLIGKGILFRSLLALAMGVGAPTYAFLRWVYPTIVEGSVTHPLRDGLRVLALCSLMSLTAGLYLAALLSDTTFLLGLDRFRGVKLLTLGTPIVIVAAFFVKRYTLKEMLVALKSHIAVYQALLAGGLFVVLGFLYLRTGNDAGGAVSESERTLRVLLDRFLGVRPRFKEFMLAHPALVCAPFFASLTGFLPTLVLILLAGVGQAGIVDTFAHVHTPLAVSVTRVFLGVLFGAFVGGVVCGGVRVVIERIKRTQEQSLDSK